MILLAPPWCKDSKNVIRFKIGPQEGGEKIGQTDRRIFVNFNIDRDPVLNIILLLSKYCSKDSSKEYRPK